MKTSMLKADTHDISANVKEEIRKALRESHIENFKELTEFAQKKRNALLDIVRDEGVSDSDLHLIEESTKMDNADVFVAMDNIKMSDVASREPQRFFTSGFPLYRRKINHLGQDHQTQKRRLERWKDLLRRHRRMGGIPIRLVKTN